MQLLDWLVVATVGAIVLVLLDGYRRKWSERRNRVVVKLDRSIPQENVDLDALPNSELPNGGARTLPREGDPAPVPRKRYFGLKDGRDRRHDAPELPPSPAQTVPVLMDPVEIEETEIEHANVFVTADRAVADVEEEFADDGLPPEVLAGLDADFIQELDAVAAESAALTGHAAVAVQEEGGVPADLDAENEDHEFLDETGLMDELADQFVAAEPDPLMAGYADNSSDDDDYGQLQAEEFAEALANEYDAVTDVEDEEVFEEEDDLDAEAIDAADADDEKETALLRDGQTDDEAAHDDDAEYDPDSDENNYENEPALLENAYRLAASHFQRPPAPAEPRIEPGFGESGDESGHSHELEPAEALIAGIDENAMVDFMDEEQEEIRAWRNQSVTQQGAMAPPPAPAAVPVVAAPVVPVAAATSAPVTRTATTTASAAALPPMEPLVKVTIPSLIRQAEPVPLQPELEPEMELEMEMEIEPETQPVAKVSETPVVKPAAPKESRPGFWETAGKAVSNVGKAAAKAANTARINQGELFQPQHEEPPAPAIEEPEIPSGPQEVIIINVMAKTGHYFYGDELLPVLQHFGLRLGSMNIFHRHTEADGNGPVMFSMANMVKPGTFTLGAMQEMATPGISFFLQMPNRHGNMKAFEQMLATANAVKQALDGDLKDERRSVLTRQTVEHCRQRVRDFELSLLSRK